MNFIKILFALISITLITPSCFAEDKIGIVMLHGKWSKPPYQTDSLVDTLKAKGYLVATPDMPWSGQRFYDVGVASAHDEIKKEVAGLKSKGANRIIVAGHSFGANLALAYATAVGNIDGVIMLAPGHVPERKGFQQKFAKDVEEARALVSAGKGEEKITFEDNNQGKSRSMRTTAITFLSYFDPKGDAVMPKNASSLKTPTPVLWVIGTEDPLYSAGEDYVFNKLPAHPKSKYLSISANHLNTPSMATEQVIEWIKAL